MPPMMTVPNVTPVSWHNDRLPEILWAAIVVSHLPRELALSLFRRVAAFGRSLRVDGPPKPGDITHSGLAALTLQESRDVIELICESDAARYFLASLLLLNDLPCREIWLEFLSDNAEKADWRILARAVAFTLDHQSQEATDCRWLKLVFLGLKGQMHFPSSMPDRAEELLNYLFLRGKVHLARKILESMLYRYAVRTFPKWQLLATLQGRDYLFDGLRCRRYPRQSHPRNYGSRSQARLGFRHSSFRS